MIKENLKNYDIVHCHDFFTYQNVVVSKYAKKFNVPFYFGGTSLLIAVGVALDTVSQIESHLVTRSYEGFLKKGRIRGRKG